MRLSSIQLEAFLEVAQVRNFTQAAKNLHITQSALSQRISALEKQLNTTVIVRGKTGIVLTEIGEKVLRYCHKNRSLEEELLSEVLSGQSQDTLSLRIAGFSSVLWTVIVPALSGLVKEEPKLQLNFKVLEVSELFSYLKSGAADFIVTTEKPNADGVETVLLGHETNVCVHPVTSTKRSEIYLDHDENDSTTHRFFRGLKKSISRSYMDDVHGILAGVAAGYGSAVVPRHLVKNRKDFRLENKKTEKTPVLLCYYKQSYYTQLHEKVVKELKNNSAKLLEG